MAQGSTRYNLAKTNLLNGLFSIPPLAEQQAIADALSDADALVEALDALIAKKRDMKHAAMQQLLTGRTRLPGYTDEWEEVRLGELLDYEQPTKYLVNGGEYQDSGSIPVLTAGKSFLLGYTSDTEGVYDKGPTILFDDFTTATQWVEFPFKVKSSACKMLTSRRPEVSLRFVYELMRTISYVPTDHMRHWIGIASEWPVIAPQSDEQQAIAEVLSDMDAEIVALVAQREKAELIEQGMMQELLSGRVRLV
jgi:type I restriction enzyme S subunit